MTPDPNDPNSTPDDAPPDAPLPKPREVAGSKSRANPAWPYWAEAALSSMRLVPSVTRAASAAGVDRRTVQRLVQKEESFAVALDDARQQALDTLEETIVLRARTGQPTRKTVVKEFADGTRETTTVDDVHLSDNLAMFFLKRWRPEYRDTYRVEQSGSVSVKVDAESLDRSIRRILDDLAA